MSGAGVLEPGARSADRRHLRACASRNPIIQAQTFCAEFGAQLENNFTFQQAETLSGPRCAAAT